MPIPSRFLFVLLGPIGNYKQYHEIGRSIATLMADEVGVSLDHLPLNLCQKIF